MNDYNQYIQIDENSSIMNAFTQAQEENYPDAIKIDIGKGFRQFDFASNFPKGLRDFSSGKSNYRWNSKKKEIEEIPEEEKTSIEEEKMKKLQELEEKYIKQIQDTTKIERYRNLVKDIPEVASIFLEYDLKKSEVVNIKSIIGIKKFSL